MNIIQMRRGMGQKPLPYDSRVEYIYSTGAQWVNLGEYFYSDTDVISLTFNPADTRHSGHTQGWLGSRQANASESILFLREWLTTGSLSKMSAADCVKNATETVSKRLSIDINIDINQVIISRLNKRFLMNGNIVAEKLNVDGGSFRSVYPMSIFRALSPAGGSVNDWAWATCHFYNFKWWRNGSIIFDLIPVRIGTTGYLYNQIDGRFFGDEVGTTPFVLGPDVR